MGYTRRSRGRRKQLKRSTNRRRRSGRRIRRTRRRKGGGWFTSASERRAEEMQSETEGGGEERVPSRVTGNVWSSSKGRSARDPILPYAITWRRGPGVNYVIEDSIT